MNLSSVLRSSLKRAFCRNHDVHRPIHRRFSAYSTSAAAVGGVGGDDSNHAVGLGFFFFAIAGFFVSGTAAAFFLISSKRVDELGSRSSGSRLKVAGKDEECDASNVDKTWYLFGGN